MHHNVVPDSAGERGEVELDGNGPPADNTEQNNQGREPPHCSTFFRIRNDFLEGVYI